MTLFTSNAIALDEKYVNLISYRLPRFRVIKHNPFRANFRCPFCGDSQKSKTKARGYAYEKNGQIWYSCRNCSKTTNVPALVKHVDPYVYSEYLKEKYVGAKVSRQSALVEKEETSIDYRKAFDDLPSIESLSVSHSARVFLDRRLIPIEAQRELKYCDAFFKFSNEMVPGKFPKGLLKSDEARIIIPVYNRKGELTAYQGRALGPAKSKYIMIALDKTVPHVFGEHKVDFSKRIYVVEGPIDSMFLSNSLAVMNSDLTGISQIGLTPEDNVVLVFDNEPRNPQICKTMRKAIGDGWKIVIWPEVFKTKDINDAVLTYGSMPERFEDIFDKHSYQGLRATVEMGRWTR